MTEFWHKGSGNWTLTGRPAVSAVDPTPAFVDASNTGPTGTLTASAGMTISTNGAVVENLDIAGNVTISGNNVTLRNCRVTSPTSNYPIRVTGADALIEHVEVDNQENPGIGIYTSATGTTIRYCNIHSSNDGIRITGGGATVEYTYVHHLFRNEGAHVDCVQIRAGDDVTVQHCNLQAYRPDTDDPMNAAIQIGSLIGEDPISNLLVTQNLMNGGNYTVNGGGSAVDSGTYSNNQFGRDYRYGTRTNLGGATWAGTNTYADNGETA